MWASCKSLRSRLGPVANTNTLGRGRMSMQRRGTMYSSNEDFYLLSIGLPACVPLSCAVEHSCHSSHLPHRSMLTSSQTCLYPLGHSPHPRDRRASRSLRPLLQALPSLHTNTNIRNPSRHLSRPNPHTRPLRFHTSFRDNCSPSCTLRSFEDILANNIRHAGSKHPPSATHE